ncbi:hypothetical protein FGIG_09619 [Fasciola gigantica]|uniref:Uncharacterized protein n=1 Tax=Fasciola gigantica TaxID=46835 RepID=A0A504YM49_FASGI|nr:hypothetical protein FGIG_09619 [Fasciola gigantica]
MPILSKLSVSLIYLCLCHFCSCRRTHFLNAAIKPRVFTALTVFT